MKIRGHKAITRCIIFIAISTILTSCAQKEVRIKNARAFIRNWNYDRALTEIIGFRRDKSAEIQYLIGLCYLNKNEFEEAVNYFSTSLAVNNYFQDSIIRLYSLGAQNALKINDPSRALFFYEELAKLVPTYGQANNLFVLGDLNYDQGNFQSAAAAYMQALRMDSTSAKAKEAKSKLIKALAESENLNWALRLARQEYQRLPTAANLLQLTEVKFALARRLFDNGMLDSAQVMFDEIVAGQEPKSFLDDAYFYIGEIYLKKNMPDAALEAYKKVLRLNPYEKGEIIKITKARIEEIKGQK